MVLIGCPDVAELVRGAGFSVCEVEYFWGTEPVDPAWVAGIVDTAVAGNTGLAVAERLRRQLIEPLVLYRPEERDRCLPRFLGAEVIKGAVSDEFGEVLERCVLRTLALRPGQEDGTATTELTVDDCMVVAIDDLRSGDD